MISSSTGGTSVESPLSPTVSTVSFTTMPTIITPPAAPHSPSSVKSRSTTVISSLTFSPSLMTITPGGSVHRNASIRSIETNGTYDSMALRSSPPFIPVGLLEEAECEPSYSVLDETVSVVSTASRVYDVVRHHVSTPMAVPMDSRAMDNESVQIDSGRASDRRPLQTPSLVQRSLSSPTSVSLPPVSCHFQNRRS